MQTFVKGPNGCPKGKGGGLVPSQYLHRIIYGDFLGWNHDFALFLELFRRRSRNTQAIKTWFQGLNLFSISILCPPDHWLIISWVSFEFCLFSPFPGGPWPSSQPKENSEFMLTPSFSPGTYTSPLSRLIGLRIVPAQNRQRRHTQSQINKNTQ